MRSLAFNLKGFSIEFEATASKDTKSPNLSLIYTVKVTPLVHKFALKVTGDKLPHCQNLIDGALST